MRLDANIGRKNARIVGSDDHAVAVSNVNNFRLRILIVVYRSGKVCKDFEIDVASTRG